MVFNIMAGEDWAWFVGLGAGAMILMILLWLVVAAIAIYLFIFWIQMIIDCAKRKFKNDTDKIVWIIVIVLVQIIGAIIYYYVVRKPLGKAK